jgi:hypothetical protein
MYPELPKIELFARHARAGWERWGNQAPPAPDEGIPDFLKVKNRHLPLGEAS